MRDLFIVIAILFVIGCLISLGNLIINSCLALAYVGFWIWVFKTAQKVPDNFTNS